VHVWIEVSPEIGLLSHWIPRQPASDRCVISTELCEIELAFGIVEHTRIAEVSERCRRRQRVAIRVVIISWGVRGACNDSAHRAELVDAVVVGLPRRARYIFAL